MMMRLSKLVMFVGALVPALWLAWRTYRGDLGVNPAETLQLETGIWTLRLLIATLAITPLRRVTGWHRLIQYRRMLGLYAFFYGALHFLTYFAFDLNFRPGEALTDVAKRPFITAGFVALVAMLPLALTSTKGWIRRLGRKWQTLHRLVYVSALAGAVHYLWKVKVATGSPVYYAAIVGALLAFRLVWQYRGSLSFRSQVIAPKRVAPPQP